MSSSAAGEEARGAVVLPASLWGPQVDCLLVAAGLEVERARELAARGLPRFAAQCLDDAQKALELARGQLATTMRRAG